jgi:hypothetical protein
MLAEGFVKTRRRSALVHHDAINTHLACRARLTALTSGGAISTTPTIVSSVSLKLLSALGRFRRRVWRATSSLGNASRRILRVNSGVAGRRRKGQPPGIPFGLRSAGAHTIVRGVSDFRMEQAFVCREADSFQQIEEWLANELHAAQQIADYFADTCALGAIPWRTLVMERCFDESGGMQLFYIRRSGIASTAPGVWRCENVCRSSISSCKPWRLTIDRYFSRDAAFISARGSFPLFEFKNCS